MTINDYFTNYYSLISSGDLNDIEEIYSSQSQFKGAVKQQFEMMRQKCQINIQLDNANVLAKTDELLIVQDKITLNADMDGQQIVKENRNLHTLVKEADEWKIHCSVVLPKEQAA
ncbi:hypothetical protein [Pseudoalteromonas luteoviolacea]|uniref:SnoaL-like domain-containing protein n=1 Tax=Pseudoalteromonas luteoviolacea S4054 TaxID=1129367 RepID=A0A0F6AI67_9GAMM|nr:hypothetical protein [Pseudoalteromonas luteoviolacea]AOT10080.1 hypothetical protein S4054249_20695 [Pseudoalteromonas luteoviolacea]AOT14991.1 hypothetical protein S40542_20660 [Pseudoalteromonas luteoviolacea]AOT19907.1 hypothetical protein S4054_20665 [Pseudoalteromonas luteoviolacea]KKE85481.1 hypothetical protein N479_25850 [Pseudoalteromonas luteoviolacea S4054]KZN68599.1 hypothetical protein N481_23200 [Pseudoalteromonas luteoviolacea S4047-1]